MASRLREGSCGVECGSAIIPGLLFIDDTSLLASDEVYRTKEESRHPCAVV